MKKTLRLFLSLHLLWIGLLGCEPTFSPEKCTGENRVVVGLESANDISLVDCEMIENPENRNQNLVIRSKNDLERLVNCFPEFPDFDFDNFFILSGTYTHSKCIDIESESAYICDGRIVYEVEMLESLCTAPTTVFYHTMIENKYQDFEVVFDIKLTNHN